MTFEWHDWRVEKLKEYWALKWSAGRIAQEFGVTRNTVSGKANRLGLRRSEKPKERLSSRPNRLPRGQKFKKPPQALPGPETSPNAVTILAVRDGQCRFPIEGTGEALVCCGAPVEPFRPYCGPHLLRAFQPQRERRNG